jgi:pSer/pThr/pTyr-binding forkhead associated (FHA) protein
VGNQVVHSSHAAPPLLVRTVRNTHRLDSGQEYHIGRDDRAEIPLADARVSWEHAVIRAEGPVWVLEDLGSRNGTFLGSERVNRLEITSPYVVHFGHPEDGPVLRFELVRPDPFADFARSAAPSAAPEVSSSDTTFMPGVLREPTSKVRIQSKVMTIGRRPDNDIVVHDLGVSKQHAELRVSPTGTYSIIDLGSHNGTFVNGSRVNQAQLKDDDIIAVGHATFRLVGGELIEYVDDGRATFEAHELQVVVHDGGKDKVLLDGITFPLAERSMMAVIGPAGAGKSTLLNALTGKRPATTGSVFYDYRDLYENYDELRQRIGLVLPPGHRGAGAQPAGRRGARRAVDDQARRDPDRPAVRRPEEARQHRHGATDQAFPAVPGRADLAARPAPQARHVHADADDGGP